MKLPVSLLPRVDAAGASSASASIFNLCLFVSVSTLENGVDSLHDCSKIRDIFKISASSDEHSLFCLRKDTVGQNTEFRLSPFPCERVFWISSRIPDLSNEPLAIFGHSLDAARPVTRHTSIDLVVNRSFNTRFKCLNIGFIHAGVAEVSFRRRSTQQRARNTIGRTELGLASIFWVTQASNLLRRLVGKELDARQGTPPGLAANFSCGINC